LAFDFRFGADDEQHEASEEEIIKAHEEYDKTEDGKTFLFSFQGKQAEIRKLGLTFIEDI